MEKWVEIRRRVLNGWQLAEEFGEATTDERPAFHCPLEVER